MRLNRAIGYRSTKSCIGLLCPSKIAILDYNTAILVQIPIQFLTFFFEKKKACVDLYFHAITREILRTELNYAMKTTFAYYIVRLHRR